MKFSRLFSVVALAPLLALGCAASPEEDTSSGDDAITAGAGVDFTASVGAVAVDGKRICTAALVDVDAEAHIGDVSASGRQVVLGGACIGKLRNGYVGGAVFVSQHNGFSLATPIVAIDFESQASAGLAVGILSSVPEDTRPMRVLGASATVSAGAHAATILHAGDDGALIGAGVSVHAGVGFSLTTRCTDWQFRASAGVTVAGAVAASERGFGATAIVKVDGELYFAASIDGQCIVHQIAEGARHISRAVLEAANTTGDALSTIGMGPISAVYDLPEQVSTVKYHFYQDTSELKIRGQGQLSAVTGNEGDANYAKCGPEWLGSCHLRPAQPFRKGQTISVTIDTHGNFFPDRPQGTRVFFGEKN